MSDQRKDQPSDIQPLAKQRFEALAGYARDPGIVLIINELEWYASRDERLIRMVEGFVTTVVRQAFIELETYSHEPGHADDIDAFVAWLRQRPSS